MEEQQGEGTGIEFDPKYQETHRKLANLNFAAETAPLQQAGVFALAIGIRLNLRVPRGDWEKGTASKPFQLFQLEENFGDFGVLFNSLDMKKEGHNTKKTIDEFLTGGLGFIERNMIDEEGNLQELKEVMPELFTEG